MLVRNPRAPTVVRECTRCGPHAVDGTPSVHDQLAPARVGRTELRVQTQPERALRRLLHVGVRKGDRVRAEVRQSFVTVASGELPRLRRFAYALTSDWHRADDLVQGALERTYAAWGRAHTADDPGAYIRTVLARLAISESRRAWRRRERTSDAVPEAFAGDEYAPVLDRLDLAQALEGLTARQRGVVVLRYLEDRPVSQVATILGISEGTVKSTSHDALAVLRRRLSTRDTDSTEQDPSQRRTRTSCVSPPPKGA